MKSRKRRNTLLGRLVFFIPVIVIIGLIVYGYFQVTAPGTIIVQAQAQDPYEPAPSTPLMLTATITVGKATATTPSSLSESPGVYQVSYGAVQWYYTPSPKNVTVTSHVTVYAVGAYYVVPRFVSVTATGGFNSTTITADHQVTPVIWVNPSDALVQFTIEGMGLQNLPAGGNMTTIFPSPGTFTYSLVAGTGKGASGTVEVS